MASFRRDYLSRPIFGWARKVLPSLSATEREAIEAGDVWWDADIFTGNPDWEKMLAFPPAKLTAEEQAFLDGPVEELCAMIDEWHVSEKLKDLPVEAWEFLKAKRFFAMIIPKQYGGHGFGAFAHSEVVRKFSTRSITAAVTAMVPNSLGPGELLMMFGTQEQRDYWLPRLADGREIPCFGLTSPEAGSDAAAMIDTGVVCKGTFDGKEVLGIRLNWHKRYITLGPVATVLGLAFKLHDPDHLLGPKENVGITVALVPTHLLGVSIGRRHYPDLLVFQNGPNWGNDVFIPVDHIIGGTDTGRQRLEDADERACRRTRHFAAIAVGGGRGLHRAHHRRLRAHPRAVSSADRQVRGDPGAARPPRLHRLSDRRGAALHLLGARSGSPSRGRHRDHEGPGDRAAARLRQ